MTVSALKKSLDNLILVEKAQAAAERMQDVLLQRAMRAREEGDTELEEAWLQEYLGILKLRVSIPGLEKEVLLDIIAQWRHWLPREIMPRFSIDLVWKALEESEELQAAFQEVKNLSAIVYDDEEYWPKFIAWTRDYRAPEFHLRLLDKEVKALMRCSREAETLTRIKYVGSFWSFIKRRKARAHLPKLTDALQKYVFIAETIILSTYKDYCQNAGQRLKLTAAA